MGKLLLLTGIAMVFIAVSSEMLWFIVAGSLLGIATMYLGLKVDKLNNQ